MPVMMNYTGTVSGNSLTLNTEFFGMPFQINLKKVTA